MAIKDAADARSLMMQARKKMLNEADITRALVIIEEAAGSGCGHYTIPKSELSEGGVLKLEGLGFEVEEDVGGWVVSW